MIRGDGTAGRALIVPVDGRRACGRDHVWPVGVTGCPDIVNVTWIWSPDDTVLVGTLSADDGSTTYYLADPETGRITPTEWSGTGQPDWQRSAP